MKLYHEYQVNKSKSDFRGGFKGQIKEFINVKKSPFVMWCKYYSLSDWPGRQNSPSNVGMALYCWRRNKGGRLETHPFTRQASDALSSFG